MAATAPAMNSAPHHAGRKRPADASLESEQRLSKRLDLLHLDSNGNPARLYIPVDPSAPPTTYSRSPISPTSSTTPRNGIPTSPPSSPIASSSSSSHRRKSHPHRPHPPPEDTMLVEDTPHRVYIADLNAELSDLSSDDEAPVFLPDIEKHIAKIPKYILQPLELKPTKDNQLVLYSVPSSLTVPEEHDRVRRAILEARQRVRERQVSPVGEPMGVNGAVGSTTVPLAEGGKEEDMVVEEDDPDAMDIDG